jgi:lipopolysaccharide transport system permease protein
MAEYGRPIVPGGESSRPVGPIRMSRRGIMALKRLAADIGEMLREQVEYRELLAQMTKRDLLLRYKQTIMGFGWAIFMPLLNTAIFSVIFMRVAPLDVGMPYPLFAFCGLLTWNFFASALRFSVASLTSNTALVTKVYFPREIFPLSATLVCLVDFAVASVVLVAVMVYYHVGIGVAVVFLPIVIAVHLVFTVAMALFLSMANLFYRDIKYIFEIAITVWMFATSVVYPVQLVGGRIGRLMQLNPMTLIIDAYRDVLLRGQIPAMGPFLAVSAASLLALTVAWAVFHRAEFKFAENV